MRTASWTDRIFLSQDPSLDIYDTVLGQTGYGQVLAAGASYTETLNVRIPDGIQGDFDIIVYADSDAQTDFSVTSDIGFGLYGVKIGVPDELNPYDLASVASRSLGRGNVPQYEDEADKISSVPLPITLAPCAPPPGDGDQLRRQCGPRLPGADARRHLHGHQHGRRHSPDHAHVG